MLTSPVYLGEESSLNLGFTVVDKDVVGADKEATLVALIEADFANTCVENKKLITKSFFTNHPLGLIKRDITINEVHSLLKRLVKTENIFFIF